MKKIGLFLSALILFSVSILNIQASDTYISTNKEVDDDSTDSSNMLSKSAKSSILIEASTGKVLYEYNSHEKLAPASMTKMMSLLIIMESIEAGVINYDDMVTVSSNASSMGGSQILLETGEEMSVDDLLKGVTIASGNDVVV